MLSEIFVDAIAGFNRLKAKLRYNLILFGELG